MKIISAEMNPKPKTYKIYVGSGAASMLPEEARKGLRPCLITDSNTEKLFGKRILELLRTERKDTEIIMFPSGEKNKNRRTKEKIEDQMLDKGYGRDTIIIALGGGVVGDMAGFVASTYNRGVPIVHVPTTLLSMVDSSIGGKTGVDTQHGKNLIGTFWQPEAAYMDTDFLKTLPEREIRSGIAEIIKHAMIMDREYFDYLEKNIEKAMKLDEETIMKLIIKSAEIKTKIVANDEKEAQLRKIANYGHTIGHAIEHESNFKLTHGESISIGMAVEAAISEKMGMLTKQERQRQNRLLEKAGLPIKVPKEIRTESIMGRIRTDKKTRGGKPEYALIRAIGMAEKSAIAVPDELARNAIEGNR